MKKTLVYTLCTLAIATMACACNDTLDVSSDYGFAVESLPVQTSIVRGETAEIRLRLIREGRWEEARYQMRWFQSSGKGQLADESGRVFAPNDLYDLKEETFRLYYTSMSDERQTVDLYFLDNHGKLFQLSFSFDNENEEESELEPESEPEPQTAS